MSETTETGFVEGEFVRGDDLIPDWVRADGSSPFPAEAGRYHLYLVYPHVNDGVYRCGFADTQSAYERRVGLLFGALDQLDQRLETRRYLVGDTHYYITHDDINPTRIVPVGPVQDLDASPGRDHLARR